MRVQTILSHEAQLLSARVHVLLIYIERERETEREIYSGKKNKKVVRQKAVTVQCLTGEVIMCELQILKLR